jgi:hypothetical protein
MVFLGDVAQVDARFGAFGDSANLDTREVDGLCRMYHRLGYHFGLTRWSPSVMWVIWNLVSIRLEILLASVQDRCLVCVKRAIGSEIILDTPGGAPR